MTAAATYRVAALPGDGVGPEVVAQARRVLDAAGAAFGFEIAWSEHLVGGCAIDAYGVPFRDEDLAACREVDAILLGAVGGPKWDDPNASVRPEQSLFKLRGELGLYANLRPVTVHPPLAPASPLRPELLDGVDLLILRELTGGLYFGARQEAAETGGERSASDTLPYSEREIARIVATCLRAGPNPAPSCHQRGQGQRPRDVATLAARCHRGRRGVPGRRTQPPARRLVRDASRQAPRRVRRARD